MGTSRLRRVLYWTTGVVVLLLAFITWDTLRYSMEPANSFEVNTPQSGPRVLIATQGSAFKDAVVAGVIDHLRTRSAYVKVVDVSALPNIKERDWNAIVVIHTLEMNRPPPEAQAFVDRMGGGNRAVVLSTSGGGDFKMQGIDAISSASKVSDVPMHVAQITARLDAILDAQPER